MYSDLSYMYLFSQPSQASSLAEKQVLASSDVTRAFKAHRRGGDTNKAGIAIDGRPRINQYVPALMISCSSGLSVSCSRSFGFGPSSPAPTRLNTGAEPKKTGSSERLNLHRSISPFARSTACPAPGLGSVSRTARGPRNQCPRGSRSAWMQTMAHCPSLYCLN